MILMARLCDLSTSPPDTLLHTIYTHCDFFQILSVSLCFCVKFSGFCWFDGGFCDRMLSFLMSLRWVQWLVGVCALENYDTSFCKRALTSQYFHDVMICQRCLMNLMKPDYLLVTLWLSESPSNTSLSQ